MRHNINDILNKYWEGISSIEEELTLRNYFATDTIEEGHLPFKDLFNYFSHESKVVIPASVGKRVIDTLLDKYWEGESTIEEEHVLKIYFNGHDVHMDHLAFTDLFKYFDHQSSITYTKSGEIEPTRTKVMHIQVKKWIYSAAAVLVLVLGATVVMQNITQDNSAVETSMVQEIEDPEEALRVTKEALALVSRKFRKSQNSVKENLGALEKVSIFK
ncbi:MAG: hypothetical protein WAU01_13495 [Saprospiraceae bacterium]